MTLHPIEINEFLARPVDIWHEGWFLLTAGSFSGRHYNTMTIEWGSFGYIWGRPLAQVAVRPTRYTYQFMEDYDTFTLSAFPESYREALRQLGSKTGRVGDKISEAGLRIVAASSVDAPTFAEAELVVECRKMYYTDINPANFVLRDIDGAIYPKHDYHRLYYGEILAIQGK